MPWSDAGSGNANFYALKMCVECWEKTSRIVREDVEVKMYEDDIERYV